MNPARAAEWNAVAPALTALPLAEECVRYGATLAPLLDLPRESSVLEAGCGAGRMLRALDALGFTHLSALELSRTRLETVRSLGPGRARLAQADTVPFRDGCFDAVVTAAVIEHVPEPKHWLAELARVTRAGGRISITTDSLMWAWLQDLGLYRSMQPLDRAIPPARLLQWGHEAGLSLAGCGGFVNQPGQRYFFARQMLRLPFAAARRVFGVAKRTPPASRATAPLDHADESAAIVAAARAFPRSERRDLAGCTWGYECYYWFRK